MLDTKEKFYSFQVYDTGSEVAIVLELCAGGELQRLLDEEERLSEGAARRALRHVLEGLQHLHARRVAHLDLKPQNLLLSADGEELVICDFGISRAIQPGAHVREILGTRDYVGEFLFTVKWNLFLFLKCSKVESSNRRQWPLQHSRCYSYTAVSKQIDRISEKLP